MARVSTKPITVNDAGPAARPGQVPVYHTHGLRQWMGTCKIHMRPDCPHLAHWKPETHRGERLAKTVIREWEDSYENVSPRNRCRTCFKVLPR